MASVRRGNWEVWRPDSLNIGMCSVVAGMRGIICTCHGEEMLCLTESYALLNKYWNELYGPQCSTVHACEDEQSPESAVLRRETVTPAESCRFQSIGYGVRGRLFIQTTDPDPVRLVHHIVKSLKNASQDSVSSLRRMIPVEATCKASMKDIETAAAELFDKYFTQEEGKRFSIVCHHIYNLSVDRPDVINLLAEMIKFRHPGNKVDLKNPQLTVVVDVVLSVCCLSVVPDYVKLHKYNIMRLCAGQKND